MKLFSCLTLALFLVFTTGLHAQITKGATFLGGAVGYYSGKAELQPPQKSADKSWNTSIQPGKAIADNKVAGFYLSAANTESNMSNGVNSSSSTNPSYGGGLFYRTYLPLSTRWYLFGQGSTGFTYKTSERKNNELIYNKSKGWNISAGITPGITFAATRRLHLEAYLNNLLSIGYGQDKQEYLDQSGAIMNSSKYKSFSATANLGGFSNIAIGLQWIIPAKKKG